MPETFIAPYAMMLPRLEAEETQRQLEALLYAGQRTLPDGHAKAYMTALERAAAGGQRGRDAPKISLETVRALGAQVNDSSTSTSTRRGEVKSE